MTLTNCYCTLAELKARIGIDNNTDDTALEAAITSASRMIDKYTGRRFHTTTADETFYFTPVSHMDLFPDVDVISITSLKTDDDGTRTYAVTWSTTDYDLQPFNSTPKLWIKVAPNGNHYFPLIEKSVEIVGKFGYSATTPPEINQACLLQAARLWKRKDSVFGIEGTSQFGTTITMPKPDIDVAALLSPFIRNWL
jgi:uncharacterized phiE125 gp8 family phage protein